MFEKEKGHYHSISNNSVSLCRILEKATTNPMVKMLLAELAKFSNLPTACPLKKASSRFNPILSSITNYFSYYRISII